MNFPKLLAGFIFNLLGVLVLYKSISTTRQKGMGEGFVEIITGFVFLIIGSLIWLGYIS